MCGFIVYGITVQVKREKLFANTGDSFLAGGMNVPIRSPDFSPGRSIAPAATVWFGGSKLARAD